MKAIIVKDDDFKTIGFCVSEPVNENGLKGEMTLFSWGISPCLKSNFQKEINVEKNITTIFELVRLQATIVQRGQTMSQIFDTDESIHSIETNKFGKETDKLVRRLETIISNLK